MKIALVVHDFDPGFGQGRYAVELARRLAPRHDVHVLARRFAAPWEPNVTRLHVPSARRSALLTIHTFIRPAEMRLRARHFDIIHAQGVTCWRANVITAHICNAARPSVASGSISLKRRLFRALTSRLERRFYRANPQARLIGVSGIVADEIQRHYQTPVRPAVIHHGVDTDHFHPPCGPWERASARARYGVPDQGWLWLFAGEAVKGLAAVLRQLPAFPAARLLVISRSHLEPFRQLAIQLGVASRVHFHGPETDMRPVYHAADVFVYPSDYDAFGLVVAEAMAGGLPVIAGRTIGVAEWIEHGRNGLLCDAAGDDSVRAQLTRLANEPSLARALGEAARHTAQAHSWDACARATLAVYESALAQGPLR
jgi:UDP-glucose:(heptosyl)LPS alpha-1,3-glucosyltransferase